MCGNFEIPVLPEILVDDFEHFSTNRVVVRIEADLDHCTRGIVTPVRVLASFVEKRQRLVWISTQSKEKFLA